MEKGVSAKKKEELRDRLVCACVIKPLVSLLCVSC